MVSGGDRGRVGRSGTFAEEGRNDLVDFYIIIMAFVALLAVDCYV